MHALRSIKLQKLQIYIPTHYHIKKQYSCSESSLDNIDHVLKCRACRFDRCLLLGMNPQALKLPENIDRNDVVVELTIKKYHLLKKYKDRNLHLSKACPVLEETLEAKQLRSLLIAESKIKKVRESNACLPPMMENWNIEKLILTPTNTLASADSFKKPANWPLSSAEDIYEQWDLSKTHFILIYSSCLILRWLKLCLFPSANI
uniref:Nuclear receptor domain-containing protein n=1 Tax=Ditylenchus dipsaci TaxID=166011 RepID=A0A915DNC7_9BILA